MLADLGTARGKASAPGRRPWQFLETGAARFVAPYGSGPRGNEKVEALHPEPVGDFVFFLGFAKANPERNRDNSPISDLIQCRRSAEEMVDQVKRAILGDVQALQRAFEGTIAPDRGQNQAAGPLPGLNLVTPAL